MTPAFLVLTNVLASLGLLGALVLLGSPVYALARRFALTDRAPLGLCWLFGLAWLSAWSWYGLVSGVRPSSVHRGLVVAAPVLAGLAMALLRPRAGMVPQTGAALVVRPKRMLHPFGKIGPRNTRWRTDSAHTEGSPSACVGALAADVGRDLMAFTVSVLAYTALVFSKLRPDDLPWATILDGDLYVYLKAADWLARDPVAQARIGYLDFASFVRGDVFGCFDLLAFGRFALHTSVENLAVPTLGLAVGMVGVAVARSCRIVFRLGLPVSLAVALVTTTGPLFLYVVLNYFLSQTLFVGILLTVALQGLEPDAGGLRDGVGRSLATAAGAVATVLCYDVWAVQYAVLAAALFAVAEAATAAGGLGRRLLSIAPSFAARAALAFGLMALSTPSRFLGSIEKLKADSVPNVAGWALPFVDPDLLLGLPVEWQGMDAPRAAIAGHVLGFALAVAVLSIAVAQVDRGPGVVARRLTLGCFCAGAGAYLLVWLKFGEAYQQWKFASTLPLGFGFAVLASAARLALLAPSGAGQAPRRGPALAGIGAFLAACLWLDAGIARDYWMANLAHHPAALAKLARALDAEPGGGPVHVALDDFNARHEALVMLARRPASFDGSTMFGPAVPPPADGRWTQLTTACGTAGTPAERFVAVPVAPGRLPSLAPGERVALSGNVAACVALSGFGSAQPWGRVTEAETAAIRFRCACAPAADGYRLALRAGVPEGVERETLRLAVDGGPPRVVDLTGSGFRDLDLPLPTGLADDGVVDVSVAVSDGPAGGAVPAALLVDWLEVRQGR